MTTATDPMTWPRETHGPVTLPRPADWTRLDHARDGQATMVLAHPEVPAGHYRPTIVVRAQPTSGSLPALGAQGIAGMLGGVPGSHCMAHDRGTVAGTPARGQLFVFDGGSHTVVVDRWLFFAGADAVEVSAMCTVEQQEQVSPVLSAVLAGVGLTERSPGGAMPEPLRDPPRDPFLQRRSGLDVESLGKVHRAQPYRPVGPVLSDDAFRLALDHIGQRRIGRTLLAGQPNEGAELVAARLMEPDGTLTRAFEMIAAPRAEERRHIRIEGVYGTQHTQLDAWAGNGSVLVASRASHAQLVHGHQEHAVPPGSVRLEVVREGSLPLVIAAWAGLAPAWTVMGSVDRLPMDVFMQRLEGGGHPPANADDVLLRLWEQPWFAWRFTMPDLGMQRSWLNAGEAGHFATGRTPEGEMMIQPTPSGHVWKTMSQEIGLALHLH